MARFCGEGAYQTEVSFRLATAVSDDGEGGLADSTSALIIPIRLSPVYDHSAARIVEQQFPGASAYQYVFYGWVDDTRDYKFPSELRREKRPIGECTLEAGDGRLECSIGAFPIEGAAKEIGEKFAAIWTEA